MNDIDWFRKCEEERQSIVLESRNKYVYCRQCDLASFRSETPFFNVEGREWKKSREKGKREKLLKYGYKLGWNENKFVFFIITWEWHLKKICIYLPISVSFKENSCFYMRFSLSVFPFCLSIPIFFFLMRSYHRYLTTDNLIFILMAQLTQIFKNGRQFFIIFFFISSIREFVNGLREKEEKINVLINNAGVMKCR